MNRFYIDRERQRSVDIKKENVVDSYRKGYNTKRERQLESSLCNNESW